VTFLFIGYDFFGLTDSVLDTRNPAGAVTSIELINGTYDEVSLTNDVTTADSTDKLSWDSNTVFIAQFNGDLEAGTIGLSGLDITEIKFKKRRVGDLDWITFYTMPFDSESDLYSVFDYIIQATETYEYAIVPVSDSLEGNYSISDEIEIEFEDSFISNKDGSYRLRYDVTLESLNSKRPSAVFLPLSGSKHPITLYNSELNYKEGTVSCMLYASECESEISLKDERILKDAILEFLQDGTPKLLKQSDGLFMIVNVAGDVVLTPIEHVRGIYSVSFPFTEVGDPYNEDDLLESGLIEGEDE
jgi:hypothetical protein